MSLEVLDPRESAEFIVENAKFVEVLPKGINTLAEEIINGIRDKRIDVANFSQHDLHPKPTDATAIEWIFVVDTLNFCFWTPPDKPKYNVNGQTGYFALCAAINRAMQEGLDITNANFYATIDEDTLQRIFRSDDGETKIPLLQQRLECLHEVGKRLLEKWNGKFENVVRAANRSAKKLLQLVVSEFLCFRDEAVYANRRVAFYKRAQILIGDLWACFCGEGLGAFDDLDCITMFADYRVPQVLVHFESLRYSEKLLQVLNTNVPFKLGDEMESEIRGASIYIVEKVKEAVRHEMKEKYPELSAANVNSILIDHFLWDYRRQHAIELEKIPFHKVYGIYY